MDCLKIDRRGMLSGLATLLFVGPGCLTDDQSEDTETVWTPECADEDLARSLRLSNHASETRRLEITVRTSNATDPVLNESYDLDSAERPLIDDVFTENVTYTVEATHNGTTSQQTYTPALGCNRGKRSISVTLGTDGRPDIMITVA